MAITQLSNPSAGSSLQDALWHVFNTNVSGQTDFKYVFDIYVNGVQQIRAKIYPEPSNNKGYFDAAPVVRNTLTYNWLEPKEELYMCSPSYSGEIAQTYQYRIGEEYSGNTYLNLSSGSVIAANWNAPLFKRRVANPYNNTDVWTTNRPKIFDIELGYQNQAINASLGDNIFIGNYGTGSMFINVVNQSGTITYSDEWADVLINESNQLNIGSTALNDYVGYSIITSTTKYYQLEIDGGEIIRVNLDCNPKYKSYNLHFLNDWGMFDTAKFDLVSKLTMDIDRKGFEQRDYRFNSTSVDYLDANNKYYEGKVNYQNKKDFPYKLTMNAPSDLEYEWLSELVASPQIYLEVDGYYYPVSVKATNYEFSKYVNNRLRVFEIEVEFNSSRYSQLR